MNKTIWKYAFAGKTRVTFEMPIGSEPVRVATQGDDICIWAVVSPETEEKELRKFYISGTGHGVAMKDRYIGSATQGPFEWHIWEKQ